MNFRKSHYFETHIATATNRTFNVIATQLLCDRGHINIVPVRFVFCLYINSSMFQYCHSVINNKLLKICPQIYHHSMRKMNHDVIFNYMSCITASFH